ncbi:acyl-CoA dehydrogenase [Limnohabitans sp. 2KL-1]|uniref:acyl-CoA dehydrogenase n=1 Tax=Limnohabitans sp. 2KL-1 TaxID=1100699 RepID=UPI000D39EF24|nr:acyl-CoA dehydrogenase [Limnohabitans sp. 2KL-1]PUE51034.1 acyl-CoA dehydrogenase [Limnohabitans sp. 2KL-1]
MWKDHQALDATFIQSDLENWTAYRERAQKSGREFVAAVDSILPIVRAGRDESERLGKVSDASVQAMVDIGVFRALTPVQFGGLEMDPSYFFEGIIKIAAADPSAAWIGGQLTIHSFEVALMDPRLQQEFWGQSPDTRASSSYAPLGKAEPVDGGYLLNGTWTFSSGIDHATWVVLGGRHNNYVVPTSDVSIDNDSWDVQGLKGTGSKSVTLKDVFVPSYRVHSLEDHYHDREPGMAINNRPLFRMSWRGLFNAIMPNSAIGMTQGALEEMIAQTRVRCGQQGTGSPVVNNPFLQARLAKSMTAVRGVQLRQIDNWRQLFEMACRNEQPSRVERMRVRYEASDAAGTCFEAFCEMWPHAGAGAVATSNPLQNAFRDLMAMRNHGSAGRDAAASMYVGALFDLPVPPIKGFDMGSIAIYK